jgi:hypothetical protein
MHLFPPKAGQGTDIIGGGTIKSSPIFKNPVHLPREMLFNLLIKKDLLIN